MKTPPNFVLSPLTWCIKEPENVSVAGTNPALATIALFQKAAKR